MALVHGKFTVTLVGAADISQYVKTSELERTADAHDTTTYSATREGHDYEGGLLDGKFTMSGNYDSTAGTGPRAVLGPAIGTKVQITRRPEGTGAGKPQDIFQCLVTKYVETNPVADYVQWSFEGQVSGTVNDAAQ